MIIISSISEIPTARLNIDYEILAHDKSVIANGRTMHGFIDKSGKPKRPPAFLVEKIKTLINNQNKG